MKTNNIKEEAFSFNGEEYYDDLDYIEDNLDEDMTTVYIGTKVKKTHSHYINMHDCFEGMADRAWEDADEWAESYCDVLNKISKEHRENMEKILIKYMDEHIEQPSFFLVENVREISVEDFKKEYCQTVKVDNNAN